MLLEVMTGIKRRVSGEHQGLVRLMIAGDIIKCLIIFNNTQLELAMVAQLDVSFSIRKT